MWRLSKSRENMKLISELKLNVGYTKEDILNAIEKKYGIFQTEIKHLEIVKESIDARKKPAIFYILNVAVDAEPAAKRKLSKFRDIQVDHSGLQYKSVSFEAKRPVVVGFGPSGMFAGLALALSGLNPIILEQGKCVNERQRDIDEFWKNGKLNPNSNVQFGEGGAGTYSDGKLASNVSNAYTKKVINEFVLCGAPPEIFYSGTPHIGSDKLKTVVTNLRKKIESLGGEVHFNSKFVDFTEKGGTLSGVIYQDLESGNKMTVETDSLVLAVGHSAEDVYNLLSQRGCTIVPKPFAMGVRIEGLQSDINIAQYGKDDAALPPANYKLVEHLDSGRSVFTFCMCPGGQVVASSSEEGTIVTNGMSNHKRNGKNSNSAVLVNVTPQDFDGEDALAGVRFQRKYEKLAFNIGGGNYHAPIQRVDDFLNGNANLNENFGRVLPTYLPGVRFAELKKCLPDFVYSSLLEALPKLNKKVNGLAAPDNLLVGVESRSSAPVQISRDENFMCSKPGIFVCGEGAGYAGGITSSAQDGIKCAESVIKFLEEKTL